MKCGCGRVMLLAALVATACGDTDPIHRRARLGDTEAQLALGLAYDTGRGVEADASQAARWYRAAAEGGHPKGQAMLAQLYLTGRGVPRDPVRAYAWFRRSADAGEESARLQAELLQRQLSEAQLSEARRLAGAESAP
jgi:TPR repeat protein